MGFHYDKDKIKESLSLDQVFELLQEFGAEPEIRGENIVCKTICHNGAGNGSKKLNYYSNTNLFRCYTECTELFDVFDLVSKVKDLEGIRLPLYTREGLIENGRSWELFDSVKFIADFFGFSPEVVESLSKLEDWKILSRLEKIEENKNAVVEKQSMILKEYDDKILKNLPKPLIVPWIEENMTQEVLESRGISYNPISQAIVIPHWDMNSRLVGIRERTLILEDEKYGKYRPSFINGQLYNHPLSFTLYNLNFSKENIKKIKKVFVFESEKSCLLYASYFGKDNDLSVAVCGSNLISYQFQILMDLGVQEICICFDKDYKDKKDSKFTKFIKKLKDMNNKYGSCCKLSFLFDKGEALGYKCSPIDCGSKKFLQLYKNRIIL